MSGREALLAEARTAYGRSEWHQARSAFLDAVLAATERSRELGAQ